MNKHSLISKVCVPCIVRESTRTPYAWCRPNSTTSLSSHAWRRSLLRPYRPVLSAGSTPATRSGCTCWCNIRTQSRFLFLFCPTMISSVDHSQTTWPLSSTETARRSWQSWSPSLMRPRDSRLLDPGLTSVHRRKPSLHSSQLRWRRRWSVELWGPQWLWTFVQHLDGPMIEKQTNSINNWIKYKYYMKANKRCEIFCQ